MEKLRLGWHRAVVEGDQGDRALALGVAVTYGKEYEVLRALLVVLLRLTFLYLHDRHFSRDHFCRIQGTMVDKAPQIDLDLIKHGLHKYLLHGQGFHRKDSALSAQHDQLSSHREQLLDPVGRANLVVEVRQLQVAYQLAIASRGEAIPCLGALATACAALLSRCR